VTPATGVDVDVAALVDRLAAHRALAGVPRSELEWLAAHGEFISFKAGDIVERKGQPVSRMVIQFTGKASLFIERGTGRRHLMETHGGDVTSLLPFSRTTGAPGDVVVTEDAEGLSIHRDHFPEMIRECPQTIETLVHQMVDRSRAVQSTTMQDDKMTSLGRLAAGLAHELNNPASAAARSAKLLSQALTEAHEASHALGAAHLSDGQRTLIADIGARSLIPTTTGIFSAIERSDREDEITGWLERHHANLAPASASALAESGLTTEALDELAESLAGERLDAALRWIGAEYAARSLASDVERATTRIYDLVSSVKRFTYMDRSAPAEPTDVAQGLADTVAMLASKARAKSVSVSVDAAPDLPRVSGNPGELNQVWSNLIANALDAVGESGHVAVRAARDGETVVVRVVDDGPGISPEIVSRIFDPFFTTKPIGQGTGLGLDISRQIIRNHDGQIAVDSRPGRTEFRVILPLERRQNG
jgi:signal transduction histidine kinase